MARYVGVDGCRFGWVAVAEEAGRLEYRLFGAMSDVLAAHPDAERILVDIPIGLPSKQCPVRPCDLLARKLLGAPRASSVFPPPSRAACRAASVAEARRINLSEVERSLSEQAWGICRKVAEVDALLLAESAARKVVREMHPEVCFYGLNARRPMAYAKRTKAGAAERLTVLTTHEPRTRALLERLLREHRRKDVQADDLLDALVGYVTARAETAAIQRVQGSPACDDHGLPMEMLYLV